MSVVNLSVPAVRPLSRSALAARVYDTVQTMILEQEIAPGAHVSIDQLSQALGVSQTPVREALARLEGDALVVRGENGRLHVAALLDREAFEALYVMRLTLEPLAASLAALSSNSSDHDELTATIARMSSEAGQARAAGYVGFLAADTAFHGIVAAAGRNRFLAEALHHLHSHHRLAFLYRRRGVVDWQLARNEHAEIADAIAARKPDQAERLMRAHIERSRGVLRACFGDTADPDSTLPSHC